MADVSLLVIYVVANFTIAFASIRSLPPHLTGGEYADVDDDGDSTHPHITTAGHFARGARNIITVLSITTCAVSISLFVASVMR